MSKLASILTTADLPLTELHALRLDGELFAIDDAFSPIDQPESVAQRAAALEAQCSDRLIAEQRTAAWVWGACDRLPVRLELCAHIGARARISDTGRIVLREVVIDSAEVVTIGQTRVTTPLRTAIDLLRFQPSLDAALVARLLRIGGLTTDDCQRYLEARHNLPHKKIALARVKFLASDPVRVVDGVDATNRAEDSIEVGRITHLEDVATEREALSRG